MKIKNEIKLIEKRKVREIDERGQGRSCVAY